MRKFSWPSVVMACALVLGMSCASPRPRRVPPPPPRPPKTKPAPVPAPPPPAPVTELRGMWVSDTTKLDWNEATSDLQRAGFNAMYVNLASGGAALYPGSKVLPSVVSAERDPVARGIALAHQRGLAVHAKLIAFYMFKTPAWFQQKLVAAGRVMRGADGKPLLQTGTTWLCPSQPANRAMLAAAVTEMLTRYPVDGLHLDYIRFFEEPGCYCAHCRAAFELATGHRVKRWPADVLTGTQAPQFLEWKKQVITGCVHDLATLARQQRPGVKVSAAVFHDLERARHQMAQDWAAWLQRRAVDYVCTMSYTTDPHDFEMRIRRQQAWVGRDRLVIGIGSYKFKEMAPLRREIDTVRRFRAPGFVLFSYDDAAARDFLPNLNR